MVNCGDSCINVVRSEFDCYTLNASMIVNGTEHRPKLFRSYADAKATDFQCALKECRGASGIRGYVKSMMSKSSFECYYRPDNVNHVYVESGDWNQILTQFIVLIIFTVVGGIFDLVIILGILWMIGYCFRSMARSTYEACCSCNRYNYNRCVPWQKLKFHIHENLCLCCMSDIACMDKIKYASETGNLKLLKHYSKGRGHLLDTEVDFRTWKSYPLIIAAAAGHNDYRFVKYLILQGANTQCTDTAQGRTALHYAIKNTKGSADLINLLIKNGCSQQAGSLLVKLFKKKHFESIRLLIEAGYPLHKETDTISHILSHSEEDIGFCSYLFNELENPAPLQRICRTKIRSIIGGKYLQKRLDELMLKNGGVLPELIVRYLKLDMFDSKDISDITLVNEIGESKI